MSDKIKILVVDDQIPVGAMMVHLLTRAGCEAESARNAEQALRLAQARSFDLISLDLEMPDVHGFELFRQLRQIPKLKETPIVFVSGRATIENQQYALGELGAKDFIEKPFDGREFVLRILSLLEETTVA